MPVSKTIVISCAGTGSRLGFGHSKALLKINRKPLIIHHLEQLDTFKDVRIVVGFDARRLMEVALSYRKDLTFVFNHNYMHTYTLTSLQLGARYGNEYIVSLDGDLLVAPKDFKRFLALNYEAMGYIDAYSDEPVYTEVHKKQGKTYITNFNRKSGDYEWTGLIQIKRERIVSGKHVYHLVKKMLPFRAEYIHCREIDTPEDYNRAVAWASKLKI